MCCMLLLNNAKRRKAIRGEDRNSLECGMLCACRCHVLSQSEVQTNLVRHKHYTEQYYARINYHAMDQLGLKRGGRTEDALASLLTAVPFRQNKRENLSSGKSPNAATLVDVTHAGAHDREASHHSAGPSGRSQVHAA